MRVLIMPRALSAVLVGPEQHHAPNWPEASARDSISRPHSCSHSFSHSLPKQWPMMGQVLCKIQGCDNENKTKQTDMVLTLSKLTVQMGREKINKDCNLVRVTAGTGLGMRQAVRRCGRNHRALKIFGSCKLSWSCPHFLLEVLSIWPLCLSPWPILS